MTDRKSEVSESEGGAASGSDAAQTLQGTVSPRRPSLDVESGRR